MTVVTPAELTAPLGAPQTIEPPKTTSRFSKGRTAKYALLIFFTLLVLIPVYVLVVTSFKGQGDASPARAWNLPQVWVTENWTGAWQALSPALWRTFQMVVPAAIISSFLGSMNGFVLARWRFRGADIVFTLILFGMFIPYLVHLNRTEKH